MPLDTHVLVRSTAFSRRQFTRSLAVTAFSYGRSARAQEPGDPSELSLTEAVKRIQAGRLRSEALAEAYLSRISTYDRKLNTFITVAREQALAEARQLDAEAKSGKFRGPLHGIPLGIKDNIDTARLRTTAASALFDDRVPEQDAEVVTRLRKSGAVLVGKTNLHEFAFGGTSATSYYGPVRNPWKLEYAAGGSSGGSAAAVAVNLCAGALGTDTGGSIRTPASFCGVVGLKPTYGLVPTRGIIPLALSLDHCGPICRTVEDAALMMNVLAGYDRHDITSVEHRREDYVAALEQPVKPLRLGVPRAPFFDMLDDDIAKAVEDAIAVLARMTTSVKDVSLPAAGGFSMGGETFAYHEEYFTRSAGQYMLPERRALQSEQNAKAAEYVRSRWRLETLRRTIDESFSDFDLVVLPTRRHTPRTVEAAIKREEDEKPKNPEKENTQAFDAYGIPAVSVPCGFSTNGVPVGLMIAGPRFSEGKVLALARVYQNATEWHKRRPPLTPSTPVPKLAVVDDRFK